jgi:hypothetical protein
MSATFKCKMLKIYLFPQKSYNYVYTRSEIIFHRIKKELLFITITGSGMEFYASGVEGVKYNAIQIGNYASRRFVKLRNTVI